MTGRFQNFIDRINSSSSRKASLSQSKPAFIPSSDAKSTFLKAPDAQHLFPVTNPLVDGEDCSHDCETCTIHLPSKFSIDRDDVLYGHINGWSTHMIVATGQTDWVKDVTDVKGSVMEAVGKAGQDLLNGKLMLSASNMPLPEEVTTANGDSATTGEANDGPLKKQKSAEKRPPTRVLLLPSFTFVENVTPASTAALLSDYVAHLPTNSSPLTSTLATPSSALSLPPQLRSHPCPHQYLILVCSQKTRDARCGQSAPLLRRELERHLRPLGLYRDLNDERPGGVGIYFISHVGGHKYSANMMVYRRAGSQGAEVPASAYTKDTGAEKPSALADSLSGLKIGGSGEPEATPSGNVVNDDIHASKPNEVSESAPSEAAQCIWIARVRPEDCENIVKYTVLQGKVVKPDTQLRGGFDRTRGLTSW